MYDYDETKFRIKTRSFDFVNKAENTDIPNKMLAFLDGKKILNIIESVYVLDERDYVRTTIVHLEKI